MKFQPLACISRRSALAFLTTIGLPALHASPARASLARALSVLELAQRSEAVGVFTPVAAKSVWETVFGRRRIVTYSELRIDEVISGNRFDSPLLVRTLGGRVGNVGQIVHGEAMLIPGEPCVAFVRRIADAVADIPGMSQGHFPLTSDPSDRRLRPSGQGFALSGRGASQELGGRTLAEARSIIVRAWHAR